MSQADARDRKGLLAQRLNELFETRTPLGRPYRLHEVADAINKSEGAAVLSVAYLSALRTGTRVNPSFATLDAIARFFQVPVTYFSDDATHAEVRLLDALQDSEIRQIALCAADLSPGSLAMIADLVRKIRRSEGLPDEPGADERAVGA